MQASGLDPIFLTGVFRRGWAGWLVAAVLCASFLGISPLLRKDSQHPLWGSGLFFGLIAVSLAIRHWKSAPQRWDD